MNGNKGPVDYYTSPMKKFYLKAVDFIVSNINPKTNTIKRFGHILTYLFQHFFQAPSLCWSTKQGFGFLPG